MQRELGKRMGGWFGDPNNLKKLAVVLGVTVLPAALVVGTGMVSASDEPAARILLGGVLPFAVFAAVLVVGGLMASRRWLSAASGISGIARMVIGFSIFAIVACAASAREGLSNGESLVSLAPLISIGVLSLAMIVVALFLLPRKAREPDVGS